MKMPYLPSVLGVHGPHVVRRTEIQNAIYLQRRRFQDVPRRPIRPGHGQRVHVSRITLDQINSGNVNALTVAWAYRTPGHVLKSTPLEVNGVLYFSSPDHVWAVDAKYGREIWHFHRTSEGDHIGNRGVGMYKSWLYVETPDAHLISLNARDGTLRWDVELADGKLGYFATMAPLVVRDHVIVG